VQIVYTRGGNAAMQALVGGAVDYAATALDVAIQAYANVGATSAASRSPGVFLCCHCHRSQDRRPDSIDQGSGGKDGRRFRARQCRSCADALLLKAGRRHAQKVQFATMGVKSAGSIAPGPNRRRPGAGAGFDTAEALGARVLMTQWTLKRQALSRRFL